MSSENSGQNYENAFAEIVARGEKRRKLLQNIDVIRSFEFMRNPMEPTVLIGIGYSDNKLVQFTFTLADTLVMREITLLQSLEWFEENYDHEEDGHSSDSVGELRWIQDLKVALSAKK